MNGLTMLFVEPKEVPLSPLNRVPACLGSPCQRIEWMNIHRRLWVETHFCCLSVNQEVEGSQSVHRDYVGCRE